MCFKVGVKFTSYASWHVNVAVNTLVSTLKKCYVLEIQ